MTVPHLMNCDHNKEGWCLDCVAELGNENWRLQKEIAALQIASEPVAWQFKDSITGDWCNFMNEKHRQNTTEDGGCEIRALYAHPAPQKAAQLADDPAIWECKAGGLKRLSQSLYDKQPDEIKRWYSRIPAPQAPMTDDQRGFALMDKLGPIALTGNQLSLIQAFGLGIDAAQEHHKIVARL